ncbi:MAG: hypothetical protein R3C19_02085 [Planctomycetaceae bacterium]
MASIQQDRSGNYHIAFRFGGKRYKRSLKTKHNRKADAAACHVEENIRLIGAGRLELPDDVDIPTYLMSDGNLKQKPQIASTIRLKDLFREYQQETPDGSLEDTTLKVIGVHMRHGCRIPGERTVPRTIRTSELQRYVTQRSKQPGKRGRKVSAVTIRMEISTLRSLWNRAE